MRRTISVAVVAILATVAAFSASVTATAAPATVRPIKIVVIGDSFSAGNGAGSYQWPTGCYRSTNNWAARYASWLKTQGHPVSVVNRACDGGVTRHYREARDQGTIFQGGTRCVAQSPDQRVTRIATGPGPRPGTFITACDAVLRPQMDALDAATDLVVFTFGGNDVSFGDIVKQCFVVRLRSAAGCRERVESAKGQMGGVQNNLKDILLDMHGKLRPDAKVVLLGYPQLIGSDYGYVLKSYDLLHRVTDSYDAKANVRQLGQIGRDAQRAAVAAANAEARRTFVTYVDQVQAKFGGHEPGPRPSHPNPARWLHEAFDTPLWHEWYHPNNLGHTAYAELLQGLGDLGVSHPAATAGSLDLVFAIDTTGSMAGTIDSVKRRVETVADRLAAGTSSYRLAVVSFRDHPEHTGDSIDYPSRVDQGFTSDVAAVRAAVGGLEANGGGDGPESAYSGITAALNLDWRPGVKKHVIVFTDVDAHDPEPVTGLTADDVVAHAAAIDPAVINVVDTGGGSNLVGLAGRTGGLALQAATDADVDTAMDGIVTTSLQAPFAWVGEQYLAAVGAPVRFDASGSFDPSGGTLRYEWDVDNNGSVEATTDTPELSWTYTAPYSGLLSVRVASSGGLSSFATAQVVADADGDGVAEEADNCPEAANVGQEDYDNDKTGDVCDDTPGLPTSDAPGVAVEETLNSQPNADDDEFTGAANQPLAVPAPGVLGNDLDPDSADTLQARLSAPPAHGSVSLQADGSFSYTPNSGYSGDDSFRYVAEDGHGGSSTPATVTIHLTSAPSTTQRLIVVAGGKHPDALSGRVVEGSFDIVRSHGRIRSVSGTGTVKGRKNRTWVVTIEATRSARGYTAKVSISKDGGRPRSWSGSGALVQRGRNTVGAFRDHRTPFGFVIQTRK